MSGRPGRRLFLRRYLNPSLCRPQRSIHSGLVSALRTFDIATERCFLERVSVMFLFAQQVILRFPDISRSLALISHDAVLLPLPAIPFFHIDVPHPALFVDEGTQEPAHNADDERPQER
jgi:hypothetical protein